MTIQTLGTSVMQTPTLKKKTFVYLISNRHRHRMNYRHSKNGLYHIITGVAFNSQAATQGAESC